MRRVVVVLGCGGDASGVRHTLDKALPRCDAVAREIRLAEARQLPVKRKPVGPRQSGVLGDEVRGDGARTRG